MFLRMYCYYYYLFIFKFHINDPSCDFRLRWFPNFIAMQRTLQFEIFCDLPNMQLNKRICITYSRKKVTLVKSVYTKIEIDVNNHINYKAI